MKNPKVSIVLPCYNGAKMIGEAIESVIAQTYKDWELIIVNDCSTDNTLEVAQSYADKDQRIRVFSNEKNSKLPASLNHGFREARGEFWTWTSDDNLLLPTMLEEMTRYLEEHPLVGFIASDFVNIDEEGNVISYNIVPDDMQEQLLQYDTVGAAFMYRSAIAKLAGEYREDLFLVEDYEYWLRMSAYTRFAHLPLVLYQYRMHSQSLSATKEKEIARKTAELRLIYLDQIEEKLSHTPQALSLFYYRIVDNVNSADKVKYYIKFTRKMPFLFGVKYIFIHLPNRFIKRLKRR